MKPRIQSEASHSVYRASRVRPYVREALKYTPLILLAVLLVTFAAANWRIVAVGSLLNILAQSTPIAVLAVGAMVVLLSGGIDLSAGVGVAFCAMIMASLLTAGEGLALSLTTGLVTMLAFGFLNGALVAYLMVPPFVATLATMVALQGATLAVASSGVFIIRNPLLRFVGIERSVGIPNSIFMTMIVAAVAGFAMRHTRFGLRTFAMGSDRAAAELSGIPIRKQTLLVYAASGLFTFLTAATMVSRVPVVTPDIGGVSILLDAIAAAVIGGTSIFGGRGTVWGAVVGAIIVSLITTALRVFGTDPSSIDLYKGLLVIAALISDSGLTWIKVKLDVPAR